MTELYLNGNMFDLDSYGSKDANSVAWLKKWLDGQPEDQIFTSDVVAKNIGKAKKTINHIPSTGLIPEYWERLSKRRGVVWGNPKAISVLRERIRGTNDDQRSSGRHKAGQGEIGNKVVNEICDDGGGISGRNRAIPKRHWADHK